MKKKTSLFSSMDRRVLILTPGANACGNSELNRKILLLVCVLVFLISNITFAQSISDNWFFGDHCGIKFDVSGNPSYEAGGQTSYQYSGFASGSEGVASISNSNGQLLFYTDGRSVWNSLHVKYPVVLEGSYSSTQSAIISPRPGYPYEYYIYTVGAWGANYFLGSSDCGFGIHQYRVIVDQNTNTNITIASDSLLLFATNDTLLVTEKITTVCKSDSNGLFTGNYWLIGHGFGNIIGGNFYVWEITSAGAQIPVNQGTHIQTVGKAHGSTIIRAVAGYLKASKQADQLALACSGTPNNPDDRFFELFHFNNKTGLITENRLFYQKDFGTTGILNYPYGVEFSPSGEYFYGSTTEGGVYQFNTSDYSVKKISTPPIQDTTRYSALQLAINNKIYVARYGLRYISAIDNPDDPNAIWTETAIDWSSSNPNDTCGGGLPNFIQCLVKPQQNPCDSVAVRLTKVSKDSCCYNLEISNRFSANYFTGIKISSPNSSLTSAVKDVTCTWADMTTNLPNQVNFAEISSSGGLPTNSTNTYQPLGTLCFNTNGGDNINVYFIGPAPDYDTVCISPVMFECIPTVDTCSMVDVKITGISKDNCCYKVEFSNWFSTLFFTAITIISPNASMTSVVQDTAASWATITQNLPGEVNFAGLDASGSTVPVTEPNVFQALGTICFNGRGKDSIYVNFVGPPPNFDTICRKIVRFECISRGCCDFSNMVIPNGITPNDDGKNDVFEIIRPATCCCISIKVFNRWGNMVYKDGDYKNDWKGVNQSGDKLVQGTYYVLIELPDGAKKGTYIDIRY